MTSRCAAAAAAALALLVTCACFEDGSMPSEQTHPGEDPMRNVAQAESLIVDLERAALEQFGRGEIDGPLALCDDRITYFDPYVPARIEDRETLAALYEEARGKPQYARFEMVGPAARLR